MSGFRRREFLGAAASLAAPAQSASSPDNRIRQVEIHLPVGLLRLRTSSGIEGNYLGLSQGGAEALLRQAHVLRLNNPIVRERIWVALAAAGLSLESRAAADIALWDLNAKMLGLPAFRLAGGFRQVIPVCQDASAAAGAAARVDLHEVARALASQTPDVLRIDAISQAGFTGLLKTLRAAEAFGVPCALDGPGPALRLVHAHALAAASNALLSTPSPGTAVPDCRVADTPGFGFDIDWREVERRTERVLRA
jgi:L-alanine-DL-glutamate epimerase-like enolase superfamily enzyme